MLIAIPSETPGGLDAPISDHFGHCAAFTLVRISEGQLGEVTVLPNTGHEHGGCMAPVQMLQEHDVSALITGGMGSRPLSGFQRAGIGVYHSAGAATVREAAELMAAGGCQEFGEEETCGGGCSHHGHHHIVVERPPLEGPADVRADRVVSFHLTLTDENGQLLQSSDGDEPIRYLHGHDNLPPGLEQALVGLTAGCRTRVEMAAADGYGERDEAKVMEVPRDRLPPEAEVGAVVHTQRPDGRVMTLSIVAMDDKTVRLDGNHPLAGKDLVFDVTIVAVEAAVPEELEHGHPH
jgi:FKBP-type peptidyl-prolyl cis-trans isomerase 2/predicted Fe-Mo cluster-binding NifX family protein